MAIQLEDVIIKITADTNGLEATNTLVNQLEKKIETINKQRLGEKLADDTDELNKKVKDLIDTIDDEGDALKKAEKEALKNSVATKKQTGTLSDFNKETVKSISNLNKYKTRLENLRKEVDVDSQAFKDLTNEIDRTNKEIDEAGKKQGLFSKLFDKLPDGIKNTKVFGVSLTDVVGKFGRFGAAAGGAAAAVAGLIAVPIAAYFTKTEEGADSLAKTVAGLKAQFDVLVGQTAEIGKIFLNVFNQSFSATLRDIGASFRGIGEELRQAKLDAQELADLGIEIEEQNIEAVTRVARLTRLAKEANDIAEDTSKTDLVRLEAAKAQVAFIQELNNEEQALAVLRKDAAELELRSTPENLRTREQRLKLAQAEAAIQNIITSNQEAETTARNKINIIVDQRLAKNKAITDELQKQLDALNKLSEAVRFELLTDVEQLEFNRKKALEEIEKIRTDLEEAAAKAGREINISDEIKLLVDNANSQYEREFNRLFTQDALTSVFDRNRKDIEDEVKRTQTFIKGLLQEFDLVEGIDVVDGLFKIPEPEELQKELTDFLNKSLDIGEADLDLSFSDKIKDALIEISENPEIQQSLERGLQAATDLINQVLDARLNALDEALEKQKDVITELEEAETLGGIRQLEAAKEREAELQEEREKALANKRRISALEIAANNAQAISEGILAVTKGFGVNIAVGIATSIALAAQIAAAVASITNLFGSIPSFDIGTESVGQPTKGNRVSDNKNGQLAVVHPNERIMTADQNKRLLSLGLSNNDVVKYAVQGYTNANRVSDNAVNHYYQTDNTKLLKVIESQSEIIKDTNKALDALRIEFNITNQGLYAGMQKYKGGKKKSRSKLN